jgi:hypothetical protein
VLASVIASTGNRLTMAIATLKPPTITPTELKIADIITAVDGLNELVYITVATAFAVS